MIGSIVGSGVGSGAGPQNTTAQYATVSVMSCPSDALDRLTSATGHSNYVPNSGTDPAFSGVL